MFDKLIDLLISSLRLFRCYVTVREWERVIVVRFGKVRKLAEPGLCWLIPFAIDQAYESPAYVQTMIVGPQSLVTKDDREVVVQTLVTFQVFDHVKHLVTIQGGTQAIEDTAFGVVGTFVAGQTWEELRTKDAASGLTSKMRQKADDYGVRVIGCRIVDLTRSRSIRLITSAATHTVGVAVE